jgi:hypothetical protein
LRFGPGESRGRLNRRWDQTLIDRKLYLPDTACLIVFKLVMAACKTWRRLQGQNQLPKVVSGVRFPNGIEDAAEIKPAA